MAGATNSAAMTDSAPHSKRIEDERAPGARAEVGIGKSPQEVPFIIGAQCNGLARGHPSTYQLLTQACARVDARAASLRGAFRDSAKHRLPVSGKPRGRAAKEKAVRPEMGTRLGSGSGSVPTRTSARNPIFERGLGAADRRHGDFREFHIPTIRPTLWRLAEADDADQT